MPDKRIARIVVAVTISMFQVGCAAAGHHAPGGRNCLMGHTMVCDADRPNARYYSACRCVSQGSIDEFLHR